MVGWLPSETPGAVLKVQVLKSDRQSTFSWARPGPGEPGNVILIVILILIGVGRRLSLLRTDGRALLGSYNKVPASRLCEADPLGATPVSPFTSRLQLSVSSFLVASICLYPSRIAGVSRYLTPSRRLLLLFPYPLLLEYINTCCDAFLCAKIHEGVRNPLDNQLENSSKIFALLCTQLAPCSYRALSRPPPRPVP